jgi:chromosome segregation ATPase
MGRQRSVTPEDVRSAVAEIEAEGKAAGVVAVMSRIGGSHAVVKDLLDAIRKERREASSTALDGVIEEDSGDFPSALRPILEGLTEAWKSMVAAERERADSAIISAQQASDRRVQDAEKRLAGLQQALEVTETQLVESMANLDAAEKRVARAEARIHKQAIELADVKARLEQSQSQPKSQPVRRKSRDASAAKPSLIVTDPSS